MRYKVKVADAGQYRSLLQILKEERAEVRLASEKRHFVAIEAPSEHLDRRLRDLGAIVTEDVRYSPEGGGEHSAVAVATADLVAVRRPLAQAAPSQSEKPAPVTLATRRPFFPLALIGTLVIGAMTLPTLGRKLFRLGR